MQTISLNGSWNLNVLNTDFQDIPATVPGSVYNDLLNNHLMEDPFYRDNENKALALMDNDFTYCRSFSVPESLFENDKVFLRCEGLDTFATVYINDQVVGYADNMHRTWEFDVKGYLKVGENTISVTLASPTKELEKHPPIRDFSGFALKKFPYVRKAHCMYGWDWGPHLPDAGIWRNISVIGVKTARIRDVYVTQDHSEDVVKLHIKTNLTRYTDKACTVQVQITAPDGKIFTASGEECEIVIDNPQLWWPVGLGNQPLYGVCVTLTEDEVELDSWNKRIGLRTMTVSRNQDEWGESFSHCVNGVDVFAMGADYIPEDNIFPRITEQRTRRLLEDAKAANMNSIRVWGGGYYPDDFFFDICDELGLLVWQDMMFACACYELDDHFEESITAEFIDNVRRLRHHASLALWCGNNELEDQTSRLQRVTERNKADYIKIFEYIIPKVLKQEDPNTFYWPSSPSSGGCFDAPQDPNRGDVHYWKVWHGLLPFTDYRNHFFRYASEFGFQSFPCLETVEQFTLPEDRNVFSYVMEKHQRSGVANEKILHYISQMYLYPTQFSTLLYASQLLQAQAMQYAVEHWRRNRGRCMGAVIWQLNDCWPVASWASIDGYGRWKALHYYEKRFFAPILISCHEEGLLSGQTTVNDQFPLTVKSAHLNVSNETLNDFHGTAHWSLRRPDASVIQEGTFAVDCPKLSAVWLPEQDFSQYDFYDCYYAYELYNEAGEEVGQGSVLFSQPKHFKFQDPQLSVRLDGDEIVVTAKAYARSVEIMAGADTVLEDNYFDMNAGERRVKIVRGEVKNLAVRSVYDIR